MTRGQQQGLLLGALCVVMVGVYARALPRRAGIAPTLGTTSLAEGQGLTGGRTPVLPSADLQVRQRQRDRAQALTWTRDPFTGLRADGVVSQLTLSGILWDQAQPVAIINGEMRHIGDSFEGYHVTEIQQDRVVLTDGQHSVTLTLAP